MRYLGNKTRLAKELEPILREHLDGDNSYIEPFAGACGMVANMEYPHRVARDVDPYIVELMKSVRDGWDPPDTVSEDTYKEVRASVGKDEQDTALIGFVGYGCSFGGKWFGGLARGGTNGGQPRNHAAESARNLVAMRPKLQGVDLAEGDYRAGDCGKGNVVYCDPPYSTGTTYKTDWDADAFWDWARDETSRNWVYVSEYNAPDDFVAVWDKEHKSGIDRAATQHKATHEKLFVHRSQSKMSH